MLKCFPLLKKRPSNHIALWGFNAYIVELLPRILLLLVGDVLVGLLVQLLL